MIRVIKIMGESFDLVTKQELPKSLVLSNGIRDLALHVDDETARVIVEMLLESEAASHKGRGGNGGAAKPLPVEHNVAAWEEPEPEPAPMMEVAEESDGLEPGEEYNDPSTGAGSL